MKEKKGNVMKKESPLVWMFLAAVSEYNKNKHLKIKINSLKVEKTPK